MGSCISCGGIHCRTHKVTPVRLGLNGVPRGSDTGSFAGKLPAVPDEGINRQGAYAPITRLHAYRRDIITQTIKNWVYANRFLNLMYNSA